MWYNTLRTNAKISLKIMEILLAKIKIKVFFFFLEMLFPRLY